MSTKSTETDFDELLVRYMEGRLNKAEQSRFAQYLAASQERRRLVETLDKNTRMWKSYSKATVNPGLAAPPRPLLRKTVAGWKKQSSFQNLITKRNLSLAGLGLTAGLAILVVVVSSLLPVPPNTDRLAGPTVVSQVRTTPTLPATLAATPTPAFTTVTPIPVTPAGTAASTLPVDPNPNPPTLTSVISPTTAPVLPLPQKAQPSAMVQWSPDGKYLAAVDYGKANTDGNEMVHLWDASGHLTANLKGHTGFIAGVAWSPDSKTLATAGAVKDTTVRLWNTEGKEIKVLNQPSSANSLMWSPDGQFLAVSMAGEATNNQIFVWKVSDGSLFGKIEPAQSGGGGAKVRWSPDGKMLALQSGDNSVRLSDAAGKNIITLVKRFDDTANSIEWSPDGKMLAVGLGKSIKLWSDEGKLVGNLADPQTGTYTLSWSPDSKLLASIGIDGKQLDKVFLWNVVQARLLKNLDFTDGDLIDLAWSPDGKILAISSREKSAIIRLYSDSGEFLAQVASDQKDTGVVYLAWSPDGRNLTSSMRIPSGVLIQLWTPQGKAITTFTDPTAPPPAPTPTANPAQPIPTPNPQGHDDKINFFAWSPDGAMLATASDDKTIRLWDATGKFLRVIQTERVVNLVWSPDSNTFVTGNSNNVVQVWEASSGTLLKSWNTSPNGQLFTIEWSNTGQALLTQNTNNPVELWSVEGKLLATIGTNSAMEPHAWSPEGELLAVSNKGKVEIWNVLGALKDTIPNAGAAFNLAWSPDSQELAIATGNGQDLIQLWHAGFPSLITISQKVGMTPGSRNILEWSPDGKTLAAVTTSDSGDNTVKLWGADGAVLGSFLAGNSAKQGSARLYWSPDGQRLASATSGGDIKYWSPTGKQLASLTAPGMVSAVVWSPDGKLLATGSYQITGTSLPLNLWDINGKPVARMPGHADVGAPNPGIILLGWSTKGDLLTVISADSSQAGWLWSVAGKPVASLSNR